MTAVSEWVQEDREVELFGRMLNEAMDMGVLPEGGMPDTVIDVEEWIIACFEEVGQLCIAEYWRGNLQHIRG